MTDRDELPLTFSRPGRRSTTADLNRSAAQLPTFPSSRAESEYPKAAGKL
jgi:hypothetical protein